MQNILQLLSALGVVFILPPEDQDSRRVSRVGANIAAAARQGNGGGDWKHMLDKQLRFRVITDPDNRFIGDYNAFCVPNGTVYITRGMLHTLDDGQLAAVLAHEVAHVMARHSAEKAALRAREMHLKLMAMVVEEGHRVRRSVFDSDPEFQALRNKLHLAIKLKPAQHSQLCEYEADQIGMQLMAEACYDPRGMSKLISAFIERKRSRTKTGTKPDPLSEALDTHPPHDKRAKAVQQAMPSVMEVYKAEQRSRQAGGSAGDASSGQRQPAGR
jgi:predicted Zn-dependent protease